jgi:hypothetical protein
VSALWMTRGRIVREVKVASEPVTILSLFGRWVRVDEFRHVGNHHQRNPTIALALKRYNVKARFVNLSGPSSGGGSPPIPGRRTGHHGRNLLSNRFAKAVPNLILHGNQRRWRQRFRRLRSLDAIDDKIGDVDFPVCIITITFAIPAE